MKIFLKKQQRECYQIANNHSFHYDFHKYKDENPTNAFVGSTKSFESPNGANSIKNNNY